jgi:hypothetical protein
MKLVMAVLGRFGFNGEFHRIDFYKNILLASNFKKKYRKISIIFEKFQKKKLNKKMKISINKFKKVHQNKKNAPETSVRMHGKLKILPR